LSTDDIAALTTAQVHALTTDQIVALTTDQIHALSTTDMTVLTNNEVVAMTTDQLAALSMAQISALSTAQTQGLSADQVAAISSVATPLVLDLNGDGIQTVGIDHGVQFDLTASGHASNVGWVAPTDGFLALDVNHNGLIDNGSELFGSATRLPDGSLAKDGFQALAALDSNHDGIINAQDAQFKNLTVWTDTNQDGVSQPGELHSLASLGIVQINLNPAQVSITQNGNWIGLESSFVTADGHSHAMADVWLQMSQGQSTVLDLSKINLSLLPSGALANIDMSKMTTNGVHGGAMLLSDQDVQNLGKQDMFVTAQTGTGHVQMMIQGDAADTVNITDIHGGHWTDGGTTVIQGQTYHILNDGHAQLLIGVKIHDVTS
jgi:hypothetical protein